ncbi:hypothetical protein F5146DRAFT_1002353 [Armillaria mellea]|nr:hypothetical protein F5146DRAFT_1002353 [Armillaria mellea]
MVPGTPGFDNPKGEVERGSSGTNTHSWAPVPWFTDHYTATGITYGAGGAAYSCIHSVVPKVQKGQYCHRRHVDVHEDYPIVCEVEELGEERQNRAETKEELVEEDEESKAVVAVGQGIRRIDLPVEILTTVLLLIPRTSVTALALFSSDFLASAQAMLCDDLGMRDVWDPDALDILGRTMRSYILHLSHTRHIPAWPSTQTRTYLIPRMHAHMDNLCSLSLPSFDLNILRYHSAFGLRHIEFWNMGCQGFLIVVIISIRIHMPLPFHHLGKGPINVFPSSTSSTPKIGKRSFGTATVLNFRLLFSARPPHKGDLFTVSIQPFHSPSPTKRPLPPFALRGGSLQLTLETGLQTGSDWWSQVWLVDMRHPGHSSSVRKIVMKISLSSLLPHPHPPTKDHPYLDYLNPRQLWETENLMYNELKSLQGSIILYYYGLHKTVSQFLKSYPPHETGPALDTPLGEDYLEMVKMLYVSMVPNFSQINNQGVIHFDPHPNNMIITEDYEVVIIDFASANLHAAPEMVKRGNDVYDAVDWLTLCCDEHRTILKEWSDTGLPDGLYAYLNTYIRQRTS